ncbi:MAG: PIN domain-containing protein [Candidatus Shapirobacteria bacterium]|jgi:predicted nucleic acid-binding protein
MAVSYFIDSSFIIALANRNELFHPKALKISQEISGCQFLVDQLVVFESVNVTLRKWGLKAAKQLVNWFNENTVVVDITDNIWQSAFKQITTSFTFDGPNVFDFIHFACLKTYSLNHVLTFDQHFSQFGFTVNQ